MKEFKSAIVDAVVEETAGCRIVSLYKVATRLGVDHIKTQDCRDIMNAVLKRVPDYRAVKMLEPGQSEATASLWTTLTFIDKELEFD